MSVLRVMALVVLALTCASAQAQVIDDFEAGALGWRPEMAHGGVAGCSVSAAEGAKGYGALQVSLDFSSEGVNHIIYAKQVELDLTDGEGLSFDVKGVGDKVNVFLFIWDAQGRHRTYGPQGTNTDFHTGYADWHTCRLSFERDKPVEGGPIDLARIRRIGFMLNDTGVRKGTVCFDELRITDGPGSMRVSPAIVSPNGDGVRDVLKVSCYVPKGRLLTVVVRDASGKVVATPARSVQPARRRVELTFDGSRLPAGRYTVKAMFGGAEFSAAAFEVEKTPKLPPTRYTTRQFFPIGVWFEGSPQKGGTPSDVNGARAYYDRCFADLVAHGFNCAAIPNCPEDLWETLLASAQRHGIKVVLEIGPFVDLVSSTEPLRESQVRAVVKRVVGKIGKRQSLLRYQVRDEPPPEMVPNWLLVRRVLAAEDPTRPAFSCFCSVESLANVTDQAVLSEAAFDIYPHGVGAPPQTLGHFLPTLDAFSNAAKGAPKWAVLQSFAKPAAWRYPTAEELRAVTYLSLAAGAKGVFYFIYQTMPTHPEKLEGLIDPEGRPLPMYEPNAKLARELGVLSPLLLTLKPVDPPAKVEGDVRVGSFRDGDSREVLIVASTRPDAAATARVGVSDHLSFKDQLTGELFVPRDGVLVVPLDPGAGRVLVRG